MPHWEFIFSNGWAYLSTMKAIDTDHSLCFEIIEDIIFTRTIWDSNKISYSCSFKFNNRQYNYIKITDGVICKILDENPGVNCVCKKAYALFSLPAVHDEYCIKNDKFYKYLSAIFMMNEHCYR